MLNLNPNPDDLANRNNLALLPHLDFVHVSLGSGKKWKPGMLLT